MDCASIVLPPRFTVRVTEPARPADGSPIPSQLPARTTAKSVVRPTAQQDPAPEQEIPAMPAMALGSACWVQVEPPSVVATILGADPPMVLGPPATQS